MTNRMHAEKIHHNDHMWQIGNLILTQTISSIFNVNIKDGMGYSKLDALPPKWGAIYKLKSLWDLKNEIIFHYIFLISPW
jgi:hypothetical protein